MTAAAATGLEPGDPQPLGAHWDGRGVNFALFSRHGERVELCLFDPAGRRETARLSLPARTGDIWHGYLKGAAPGLVYGYRVAGPYRPHDGHRFNPHKLLIDPYASALRGRFIWDDAVLGYAGGQGGDTESFDSRDSAPFVPKCVVCAPPDVAYERPPRPDRPWRETVIYEAHLRGLTMRNPLVPKPLRGTIAALGEPALIAHLQGIGVTAVELLPIAAFLDEYLVTRRGQVNYWGYNPIAFLALHAGYDGGRGKPGLAATVDRLHQAGIEVILDVVFNHTAEGDQRGPTLSYRGIDNAAYYRLRPGDPARYEDFTGCGNTLAMTEPAAAALVLDALRHWAALGIDGFRFDLAPALARRADGTVDGTLPWLAALAADPLLGRLKLIAEPWDACGHFLGAFAAPFAEWNDRYRDAVRRFWRGDHGSVAEFATRIAGSSDIFHAGGRGPSSSVNFVTAHDGFTLADLVSYGGKHNEANGEDNRDGAWENFSSNAGVEGATGDRAVRDLRRRRMRSLLATLLLSRGVPMLLAGDEVGHSQGGNNNPYCQDNETTWIDWSPMGDADGDLGPFIARLIALRGSVPALVGERFFDGRHRADGLRDITWLRPDGAEFDSGDWHNGWGRALGVLIADGGPALFIAFNPDDSETAFRLPAAAGVRFWFPAAESGTIGRADPGDAPTAGSLIVVPPAGAAIFASQPLALDALTRAAQAAGIALSYEDVEGVCHVVPAQSLDRLLAAMDGASKVRAAAAVVIADQPDAALAWDDAPDGDFLEAAIALEEGGGWHSHLRRDARGTWRLAQAVPPGYHRLAFADGAEITLIATPGRCHEPDALATPPGAWALAAQIYGLHSRASWGIGDFADLAALAEEAARVGACGIMTSPVHAPPLAWPDHASPYAPSSRFALNPLYISVEEAAGEIAPGALDSFLAENDHARRLHRLRRGAMVDHPSVAALKLAALEYLFGVFGRLHLGPRPSALGEAFEQFRSDGGEVMERYAVFEAIARHHDGAPPAELTTPDSPAVARFVARYREDVSFIVFLQFIARRQWLAANQRARAAGMAVGIISDVAVGADGAGAEPWQWPGLVARAVEIGAPPDPFAPMGQTWGAPPWKPAALKAAGFAPFIALLRASMAGAGGVRIDHVMGLARLFWVPRGMSPADGGYVAYPFDALVAIVALESTRQRCLVIGEDLGTVPPGLREKLAEAGVLSYRLVYFQRDAQGNFIAPQDYPAQAAAAVSTHDLPTIPGFFAAADIDERAARDMYPSPEALHAARNERAAATRKLDEAVRPFGLTDPADRRDALHRFLAATSSRLVLVQLEDVLDTPRQANLPGLADIAPNWRQRLPVGLDELGQDVRFQALDTIFSRRKKA